MIKTNKKYDIKQSMEHWSVSGIKALYCEPDFSSYDNTENVHYNINGFYIITENQDDGRLYFYLDLNYLSYGDFKNILLPVENQVLGFCHSDGKYYRVMVEEEKQNLRFYQD